MDVLKRKKISLYVCPSALCTLVLKGARVLQSSGMTQVHQFILLFVRHLYVYHVSCLILIKSGPSGLKSPASIKSTQNSNSPPWTSNQPSLFSLEPFISSNPPSQASNQLTSFLLLALGFRSGLSGHSSAPYKSPEVSNQPYKASQPYHDLTTTLSGFELAFSDLKPGF